MPPPRLPRAQAVRWPTCAAKSSTGAHRSGPAESRTGPQGRHASARTRGSGGRPRPLDDPPVRPPRLYRSNFSPRKRNLFEKRPLSSAGAASAPVISQDESARSLRVWRRCGAADTLTWGPCAPHPRDRPRLVTMRKRSVGYRSSRHVLRVGRHAGKNCGKQISRSASIADQPRDCAARLASINLARPRIEGPAP